LGFTELKTRLWRWLADGLDGLGAWGARRLRRRGLRDGQPTPPAPRFARLRRLWRSISDADAKVFGVCFLVLLPLYWAPLFVTEILPGLDLPFHLALADMLGKRGSAVSPYATFYQGSLRVAPYAAHYLMLVGLGKVMNLLLAHKLIVALYIAAMPLSTASLLVACGRSRIPALLAFPLAYNLTLHYGFISFALSLPVLMLLLAQTVKHLHSQPGQVRRSWLWTAAAALLLFLCHLQNFLYGVGAVLGFALLTSLPWRRRWLGASTLLPAIAALAYWQFIGSVSGAAGPAKPTLAYAWDLVKRHRLKDLNRGTFLHDFGMRLWSLSWHALRGFVDRVDVEACRALLLTIGIYVLAGLAAWAFLPNPSPTRPRLRTGAAILVAFAGALAAYLMLPHHLGELDLMTFFPRFAVLVLLMAIVLVPAGLGRVSGLLRLVVPVPAVLVCALYGYQLIAHYRLFAKETADFVAVLHKTPPGGKAVGVVFNRSSRVMRIESVLLGLPDYYVAIRSKPGSMAPLSYCGMRHMPCAKTPAGAELPDPWNPYDIHPLQSVPIFDYFFVRSPPPGANPFGPYRDSMEVLAQSGTWTVYRKKPGAAIPAPAPPPPVAPVPAR